MPNAQSLFFSSVTFSNLTSMTLATIFIKKFLRLTLYSGCFCELQIFAAMCLQVILKILSLRPTCTKPKLSSFHQEWHLFVLFLFLSIIIHFTNFQGCMISNSFWLILSFLISHHSVYVTDTVTYSKLLPCLIHDNRNLHF